MATGQTKKLLPLLLADVDGTLVTCEKILTPRSIQAVRTLQAQGFKFTLISGRPARGMKPIIDQLKLTLPFAAFNGGELVNPDLSVVKERLLPKSVVKRAIQIVEKHQLKYWVYANQNWYLSDPRGPHVACELWTVQFPPVAITSFNDQSFEDLLDHVNKIVGVAGDSINDYSRTEECVADLRSVLAGDASATLSVKSFVEVSHPDANKGTALIDLCQILETQPENVITMGAMSNDILMFNKSGFSIAMGQSEDSVKKAANYVTDSNEHEGFAKAVEYLIDSHKGVGD